MRESYDSRSGRARSRGSVTQVVTATQSIIKVTEQSACFGHGGVTAFTERRVTGVLSATGFYREIAIAIQDEVGDSNGGNV